VERDHRIRTPDFLGRSDQFSLDVPRKMHQLPRARGRVKGLWMATEIADAVPRKNISFRPAEYPENPDQLKDSGCFVLEFPPRTKAILDSNFWSCAQNGRPTLRPQMIRGFFAAKRRDPHIERAAAWPPEAKQRNSCCRDGLGR